MALAATALSESEYDRLTLVNALAKRGISSKKERSSNPVSALLWQAQKWTRFRADPQFQTSPG